MNILPKSCLSSCFSVAVTSHESRFTAAGPCFGIVGGGGGLAVTVLTSGCSSFTFIGESAPILVPANSLTGCSLLFITVTGIGFWGPAVTTPAPTRMSSQAILSVRGENRASWVPGP